MKNKPEADFEKELERIAPLFGCQYIKILDTKSINKNNRKKHREVKRICDAIIMTRTANWFCECKMESAPLKTHQEDLRIRCYQYNGYFVTLRKQKRKSGWMYRITTKWGDWKSDRIEDIFKLLSDL
jgi:hypothetical protein